MSKLLARIALSVLASALLVASSAGAARAGSFVVGSTLDATDSVPGDGVCASALGGSPCTLRAAVQEANAFPGPPLGPDWRLDRIIGYRTLRKSS